MAHVNAEVHTLENVIAALAEAEQGGRKLDCMISCALGTGGGEYDQIMMRELVSEGYSWDSISELWGDRVPAYTTSLDMALAGENIRCVIYSSKRERWAAIHKSPSGEETLMWGADEVLARRLAALQALARGDSPGAAAARPPGAPGEDAGEADYPVEPRPSEDEKKEWSILF